LLDRIDLHIEVPKVSYDELSRKKVGTTSDEMRQSVTRARSAQRERFGNGSMTNARMSGRLLNDAVPLEDGALMILRQAMEELGLSARAYDKVRRVARTIADVEGEADVTELHVAEAVGYRILDRRP
jgi:magnesium chelatase family protein